MDTVSLVMFVAGVIGAVTGVMGYFSTRSLRKQILTEKDLIKDNILAIKQEWVGRRDQIMNDRHAFNDPKRNTLNLAMRLEEIETRIANLDRFAERLSNLS